MKNKHCSMFTLVILLATFFVLQSCSNEKYTIWTDSVTYSEFQTAFQSSINDGYYIRLEISDSQWSEIGKQLGSEGRHSWNEETIKKWLISNGFGESEATKESSWFALINHGFIASRDGNMVYLILK